MKITITGAAGYIGSKLTETLLSLGHELYCFDNYYYNQKSLVGPLFNNDRCHFFQEDILNWSDNLKSSIYKSDIIYPLAALVGAPLCDRNKDLTLELNQIWQEELIKKYLSNQIVIYCNSNSAYGNYPGVCTEETPINPLSLYARTKQFAEDAHMEYKRSVCFRLATVFGASLRPRTDLLINNLVGIASMKQSIDIFDGQFRRNYIHIKDLVEALTLPLSNPEMCGQIYNVGNDSLNMTKGNLIKEICRLVGGTWTEIDNRTDPDKRDYEVSSKKLYSVGFRPKFSLEYGVKEMVGLYGSGLSLDDIRCRNY